PQNTTVQDPYSRFATTYSHRAGPERFANLPGSPRTCRRREAEKSARRFRAPPCRCRRADSRPTWFRPDRPQPPEERYSYTDRRTRRRYEPRVRRSACGLRFVFCRKRNRKFRHLLRTAARAHPTFRPLLVSEFLRALCRSAITAARSPLFLADFWIR